MTTQVPLVRYIQEKVIEILYQEAPCVYIDAAGTGHGTGYDSYTYTDAIAVDSRTVNIMKEIPESLAIDKCPIVSVTLPTITEITSVSSIRNKNNIEMIITVVDHQPHNYHGNLSASSSIQLLSENVINLIDKYIYPKFDMLSVHKGLQNITFSEILYQQPDLVLQGIIFNFNSFNQKGQKFYI